jgi:hypothetical protein
MASRDKPRHEQKKPKKNKAVQHGEHAPAVPRPPLGGLPHS